MKIPNLLNKYKTIFLGKRKNIWYLSKILVSYYKYVSEPLKVLTQINWVIEFSWRLKNAKFSQGIQNHFSGKKTETLKRIFSKNFCPYWNFLYSRSEFCQNPISNFQATEHWYKAQKCKIWLTNTKQFVLEKREKPWNFSKTYSLYWSFQ